MKTKLEAVTVYAEPTREGVWATFHRRYKEPDERGARKAVVIKVKITKISDREPGVEQWGPKDFDMEMNRENCNDALEFVRRYRKIKEALFGENDAPGTVRPAGGQGAGDSA